MYGTMLLIDLSDCAAKAAAIYPQIIHIMDASGVPPDDRAKVLAYIVQVIDMDAKTCPETTMLH